LNDKNSQDLKERYTKAALGQIKYESSIRKIVNFIKQKKNDSKLKKLANKHRSQYELFQAGSGKYLLQLLMQQVEDNTYCIFSHLRPGEIDVEFERRRKTAFSKLK